MTQWVPRSETEHVTMRGGRDTHGVSVRVLAAWRELFGTGEPEKDDLERERRKEPRLKLRGRTKEGRALSPKERRMVAMLGHAVVQALARGCSGVELRTDDLRDILGSSANVARTTKRHVVEVLVAESPSGIFTATNGVRVCIVQAEGAITFRVEGDDIPDDPVMAYARIVAPQADDGDSSDADPTTNRIMRRIGKWVRSLSPAKRRALEALLVAFGLSACYAGYKAYEYLVMHSVQNERPGDALPARLTPTGSIIHEQDAMVVTKESALVYVATIKQPERFTRDILAADPNANVEWIWKVLDGDRNAYVYKATTNAQLRVVCSRVGQHAGFVTVRPVKMVTQVTTFTAGEPQDPRRNQAPKPGDFDTSDTLVLSDPTTHDRWLEATESQRP